MPDRASPHPAVEIAFWLVPALLAGMGIAVALSSEERLHPLLHVAGSAILSFLFLTAAVWRPHWGDGPFLRAEAWVVGGVVALGVAIEVLQRLVVVVVPWLTYLPGSLADLALDVLGAGAGWWCWRTLRRRSSGAE